MEKSERQKREDYVIWLKKHIEAKREETLKSENWDQFLLARGLVNGLQIALYQVLKEGTTHEE